LYSDHFQSLRFVSERQLTDILQSSSSLKQRYVADELLVHLSVMDQVSTTEVQNLLTAAIDNAQSQQIIYLQDSSIRIDQKLRSLLIRLMMVKEPDPIKSAGTIDIIYIFRFQRQFFRQKFRHKNNLSFF
jgi:hypothetical protein